MADSYETALWGAYSDTCTPLASADIGGKYNCGLNLHFFILAWHTFYSRHNNNNDDELSVLSVLQFSIFSYNLFQKKL